MIERRTFLGATGGFLLAPLAVSAQQPRKVYRIGWLELSPADRPPNITAYWLRKGLDELGWKEGLNVVVETRNADNHPERLPALAAELVALNVDVIVTQTTPAALAAKSATSTIPIVMAGSSSPVARGLVQSLARPGGNVTGLTHMAGEEFHQKLVQLLKEAAPRVSRVAVLWSSGEDAVLREVEAGAPALGMTVVDARAHEPAQVPLALAAAVKARADALLATPSSLNVSVRALIAEFALTNRLPSISGQKEFVVAGGLLSYWANFGLVQRRSAVYVDKILKGAKPADLPIEQPTKFELVINLRTAKVLGLSVPQSLLARADEVIQ